MASPGAQTNTVGDAVSLQIKATDATAGQTLTYSATSLPSGLTIAQNSGLITGRPTAAGDSTVTVSATDKTGASGTTQFAWTVNASTGGGSGGGGGGGGGGGCASQQLLANPGFETGTPSPWQTSPGVISSDAVDKPAHSGSWDAWLGGYYSPHTDTLAQTIALPAACRSAQLSFWLHVDTRQTSKTAQPDTLKVQVLDDSGQVLATLASFSNLDAAAGYTEHEYSLTPYLGRKVTIKFTGVETTSLATSFVDDDNAVTVD